MGSLVFDKCCGCIELKTGCFIIGYLNLIGIIAMVIISVMTILAGGAVMTIDNIEDKEAAHAAGLMVVIVGAILLLFLILALAFCIALLVGLHKNKPGHLKAYLIYSVIFLVIWCIAFLIQAVNGPNVSQILRDLIYILLNIYFLLVIRSEYFVMKDPRGGAIYNAA